MSSPRPLRPRTFLILAAAAVAALAAGCVEGLPIEYDMGNGAAPNGSGDGGPAAPPAGPPAGQGTLEIHVIDVGQGDSILLVTPNGRALLMDAGHRGSGDDVIAYLQARGIESVDVFVASHGDADHIGGVGVNENNVLRAFPPERVYEPGYPKTTLTYETFLDTVEDVGADYYDARDFDPGDQIPLDSAANVTFLHPIDVDASGDSNEEGIVLRVSYGNFSALLPGDIGTPAEERILASGVPVASTVLKVGHHGSRGSSSMAWLTAVSPQVAIISVGADNSYGHPTDEVLARLDAVGADVYRTDEDGSVVVTTDGATWSVNTNA